MRLMANTAENRKRFLKSPPITKDTVILEEADELEPPPAAPAPPRVRKTGQVSHYAAYQGGRYKGQKSYPTCSNKGCRKALRRDQPIACSEACSDALFSKAMDWLIRLGVTRKDIISYIENAKTAKAG